MKIDKEIIIRTVIESDIETMISHRIEYLKEIQGERNAEFVDILRKDLITFFKTGIADGSVISFVAEYEQIPVSYGTLVLHKVPGDFNKSTYLEGDIMNMYTIPSARKQGISSMILEQLIHTAKTLDVSKISLHTTHAGEKLYRNAGFLNPIYPYLEKNL